MAAPWLDELVARLRGGTVDVLLVVENDAKAREVWADLDAAGVKRCRARDEARLGESWLRVHRVTDDESRLVGTGFHLAFVACRLGVDQRRAVWERLVRRAGMLHDLVDGAWHPPVPPTAGG